tara:strand:- start:1637 stop:1969 length:333 start_codon:yes stop_codon:yes gene_type:complete
MMEVPNVTGLDMAFGNISHMPKYDAVPAEFKSRQNQYVKAISSWFFSGAKGQTNGIELDGETFVARPGVDAGCALAAIKSVLCSFEPKHEHKEAACAYMLAEWFEPKPQS